jgi:16S rRNA (cytidine1402-2'-O)-methyltransferase
MEVSLEEDLRVALREHSLRDAVDMISKAHDMPRRKIYQKALDISKG